MFINSNRSLQIDVRYVNVKIYSDLLSSIVSSYHVRISKFVTAIERLKSTFSKEFKSTLYKVFFNNVTCLEIYFCLKRNGPCFWKQLLFDCIVMCAICELCAVDNLTRLRCSNVSFTSIK